MMCLFCCYFCLVTSYNLMSNENESQLMKTCILVEVDYISVMYCSVSFIAIFSWRVGSHTDTDTWHKNELKDFDTVYNIIHCIKILNSFFMPGVCGWDRQGNTGHQTEVFNKTILDVREFIKNPSKQTLNGTFSGVFDLSNTSSLWNEDSNNYDCMVGSLT